MEQERSLALALAKGLAPTPNAIERVGQRVGPELARWAFTQWELRAAAKAKFQRAEEMLFVREALEQATRSEVSRYHASRFPEGETVADLTCGIGADLLALASRGPAVGHELDPERAEYARHNLSIFGLVARVFTGDCMSEAWPEYVFADPARRVGGKRTLEPSSFTPNPLHLAERMARAKLGGIKLTPLLKDGYLEAIGPELAFVATGGECPEVVVWCGSDAVPGRYAIFADTGERLEGVGGAGYLPTVDTPTETLFEAHPAAIRAHGLEALCRQYNLCALGDSNGYLTGPEISSPWLKSYRVLASMKGDLKLVREELTRRDSRTPVVKSRADINVDKVRRELKMSGSVPHIVAAYQVGKSVKYALLTES